MSRLTYSTPLLLVALALSACPGDDVPADTEGSSSGDSTTTDPTTIGPTTTPTTTTVDPDSGSGTEESSSGTTEADPCEGVVCDPGDECIGGTCFECSQPTCEPGCEEGETCQCDEDDLCCDMGSCAPPVCPLPLLDGNYAACLDDMGVPSDEPCDGAGCVVDNDGNPTAAVCVAAGCEAICQCPAAPATGDAVIACEDVTGDMVNDCWLDCGGGAACPDDMVCFGGFICLWSDIAPTEVPLYGDCVNVPGATCTDGFCVQAPTGGVCTAPCNDALDCEPAPLTGDAPPTCVDVTGDMVTECILDCSMGQTCADGMECFSGFVCIWPEIIPPDPGFTNCGPVGGVACPMGEDCLDDAMGMVDPTWAVCSQPGCVVVADCTVPAPVTGTAVLTCGDPSGMGAADTCYLDCSMGETCADGMVCIDGSFCAWPQGMVIFEEDFESGVFPPGWTRIDVDGLTPAAGVAFIDEAWVVVDEFEPAVNFAAYSTSWYVPAGIANDWIVTPAISLGATTTLSWEAWAPDAAYPDGYEVLVSTTGATVADFVDPPVFTIAAEADVFTLHSVDLAAAGYASQDVYIAWRNPSNDQFVLAIDNVSVFELP